MCMVYQFDCFVIMLGTPTHTHTQPSFNHKHVHICTNTTAFGSHLFKPCAESHAYTLAHNYPHQPHHMVLCSISYFIFQSPHVCALLKTHTGCVHAHKHQTTCINTQTNTHSHKSTHTHTNQHTHTSQHTLTQTNNHHTLTQTHMCTDMCTTHIHTQRSSTLQSQTCTHKHIKLP